jgi:hypothetical protein
MAGAVRTPANAKLGIDTPKVFDHEGAIGKQFTGMNMPSFLRWVPAE